MQAFRGLAPAVLLLSLAAGCIQVEQTLTVGRDGSAQFAAEYSLAEQTIEQVRAMYKLREDLDQAAGRPTALGPGERFLRRYLDPVEADIRSDLKAYERYGVTVEKLKLDARGAARYVSLKLAIARIDRLGESDFFRRYGFSLTRRPDGLYELVRQAVGPRADRLAAADASEAEATKLLAPIVGGFRATVSAVVPGAIRTTNAPRHSERTAVWTFDFANSPYAFAAYQQSDLKVVFAADGPDLPEVRQDLAVSPAGS